MPQQQNVTIYDILEQYRRLSRDQLHKGKLFERMIGLFLSLMAYRTILLIFLSLTGLLVSASGTAADATAIVHIHSGSMLPAFGSSDILRIKRFTQIDPIRAGDIVAFHYLKNPYTQHISRVIGLPGQTIEIKNNNLYINGRLIPQKYIGIFNYRPVDGNGLMIPAKEYLQSIGNQVFHIIEFNTPEAHMNFGPYKIPSGCYFVMGDNRDNSDDSRFQGYVLYRYIVGKAVKIFCYGIHGRFIGQGNRHCE